MPRALAHPQRKSISASQMPTSPKTAIVDQSPISILPAATTKGKRKSNNANTPVETFFRRRSNSKGKRNPAQKRAAMPTQVSGEIVFSPSESRKANPGNKIQAKRKALEKISFIADRNDHGTIEAQIDGLNVFQPGVLCEHLEEILAFFVGGEFSVGIF